MYRRAGRVEQESKGEGCLLVKIPWSAPGVCAGSLVLFTVAFFFFFLFVVLMTSV